MTKFLRIILLLFLFYSVKGQEHNYDKYLTVPDVFTSQVTSSYLDDIYDGNIDLESLSRYEDQTRWTVWSDRSKNKLFNSYQGQPKKKLNNEEQLVDETLDFLDELFVLKVRNNWLYVKKKLKNNNDFLEGWIKAENLILSKYSLRTESDDGVSVPRKAIILTDIDKMTELGIQPKQAINSRFFYSRPQVNSKYIIGEPLAFEIYFVLKDFNGSLLLCNNDVLDGSIRTNLAKAKGWISGANVRKWDHRIALEPTRSITAISEYESFEGPTQKGKLPGYVNLNSLERGLETGLFPDLPQVEFRVGPIPHNMMRRPVMTRINENSNFVQIVSINRETSDDDDETILKYRDMIDRLNRKQNNTNIIFAIDATASMLKFKEDVAGTVTTIVNENEKLGLNELKFGLIVYRDYKDGRDPRAPAYQVYQLTTNYEEIKEKIETTIYQSKDKDLPEAVYNGLINGLNEMNIDENESNILVLIGDCGNHRQFIFKNGEKIPNPSYNKKHSLNNVVKIFNEKSINLLSLQVNHTNKPSHFDFNSDIIDIIRESANEKIKGKGSKLIVDFKKTKGENAFSLNWRTKNNDPRDDYENMFGRFIYAKKGSMDGDLLKKSIVEIIKEYTDRNQQNITVLERNIRVGGGGGGSDIQFEDPPEGLTVHIMNAFNMSRTEAQDFLKRKEATIAAYVAMDYSKDGINALKEVVFLSEMEKTSLTRSLSKLSSDKCNSGSKRKQCFQENMIEVCRSLLGSKTSDEIIGNLTMNQVWQNLMGVEFKNKKLKNIQIKNFYNEIKNKDFKDFYEKFQAKANTFCNNNYYNEKSKKSRRFSLVQSYYYWIPLEDLPGTTE